MKKNFRILLLALGLILAASGCGSDKENEKDSSGLTELISGPVAVGNVLSEKGSLTGEKKEDRNGAEKQDKADSKTDQEPDNKGKTDSKQEKGSEAGSKDQASSSSGNGSTDNTGSSGNSGGTAPKTGSSSNPGKSKGGSSSSGSGSSSNKGSGSQNASSGQQKPEKKNITVTISVDCKTAVNEGYAAAEAISSSGTILGNKSITLKKGASVYDALKQTGLVVGSSTSGMGTYVYSIQSLAEKACGPGSGWLYMVNGSFPQTSCSKYELKDGDRVKWRYTCNDGKDL